MNIRIETSTINCYKLCFLQDLPKVIRGASEFLKRDLTEKQVNLLANYLRFDNMQKNKTVNNTIHTNSEVQFIRKGKDTYFHIVATM